MGGGLMQLVAYGAQDIYLTGNPQITFFKVVYRRHTNFSIECIEQTFNGTIGADASTVTATISRNGDLISNMHLDVKFVEEASGSSAAWTNWTNNTGHAYVDNVELEIGGQRIDKHYGHWLDVYNELTDHDGHERSLINKHSAKNSYLKSNANATVQALQVYVPLKFWFNRNPGLALPLIALQYHEVKIKLTTRALNHIVNSASGTVDLGDAPSTKLWVDYIYLDTDERRRFAQQSHEYLIEQLQYSTESGPDSTPASASISLNLNHPVKELIWTVQDANVNTGDTGTIDATANIAGSSITNKNDWFNYDGNGGDCSDVINGATSNEGFSTLKLQLNGHDRFSPRNASYFRTVQPLQAGHVVPEKHVYCYSFALKPEEHQPSGTCNFSRIDNAQMVFGKVLADTNIHVYAVNYNVLRIMSGMGGLAYSN